ncbi:adenylosuccinate lyase [Candidatus Woesearchaeota archaeon]|nr:adenylosuccinate lyase [Candidatus Woesearchaeota archaeon]
MNLFDSISPLDYRYYGNNPKLFEKLKLYLSEDAAIKYQLLVEKTLVEVLAEKKICPKDAAREVARACGSISAEDVYREEEKTKHNIRALVNCIRRKVSDKSKPYVHFTATSNDIISTSEALRLKDAVIKVVIPDLIRLEKMLIKIARKEKATLQIGRTHGQHAEPITFGFAIAEYVSRLGSRISAIKIAADNMRGKFSGAVGSYNASSLFIRDPEQFEAAVLKKLGLKASTHSTQIVEPEFALDLYHALTSAFGVIANLADDMRHLQRSEIAEVAEEFTSGQVGSSTMPHKRNPINFENVKSMWKAFMPRMITGYADQISEHQRDLTNSASSRFMLEGVAALLAAVNRLSGVMGRLVVDHKGLEKNFSLSRERITAEPLYLLLAYYNHPDAHEAVRKMTLESDKRGIPLGKAAMQDKSLQPYLKKFTKEHKAILSNPEKYTGIAAKKAEEVCSYWEKEMGRLS